MALDLDPKRNRAKGLRTAPMAASRSVAAAVAPSGGGMHVSWLSVRLERLAGNVMQQILYR
jgi:hypothetical protein